MLNAEQFILAMHFLQQKVKGIEVPKALTPEMIPPSMRGSLTPSTTSAEDKVKILTPQLLLSLHLIQQQQLNVVPIVVIVVVVVTIAVAVFVVAAAVVFAAVVVAVVVTTTFIAVFIFLWYFLKLFPLFQDGLSLNISSSLGDFTAIKELDKITKDIEELGRQANTTR